jgi:beta-lactamase class A
MRKKLVVALCILILPVYASSQGAPAQPLGQLQHSLERISRSVSADWGIYVKSLDTGEEITINADQVMDTMSVIKVPLLVDAYRQIDAGKLNPTDRITMATADKRFGTGVLRTLNDGLNLSVHDALTLMIIQSDNTATDMIFARVGGPAHVNETVQQMGFKTINATGTAFDWFRALGENSDPAWSKLTPAELFTHGYPQKMSEADVEHFHFESRRPFGLSSAREMGKLLEMIARNQAATPKSCEEMLRILRQQQMRTRIPKYLDNVAAPHKTGDFPPFIANDVGLIETDKAHIVVVFFCAHHRGIYAELEDAVARMSEQVWAYFNYRSQPATTGKNGL